MPTASGFACPKCKSDVLAEVTNPRDLVHILELKCRKCGCDWAVESSHGQRRWLNTPDGRVHP